MSRLIHIWLIVLSIKSVRYTSLATKIVVLFLLSFSISLNAWTQSAAPTEQHQQLYKNAYEEIIQMLEGKTPLSFKRAVFLMENAFLKGTLRYEQFNKQIGAIAEKMKALIRQRHFEKYQTAANWAAFTYMTDSIPQNSFKPYSYDFEHFLSDKDPTVGFVTKLLSTGKGNCFSLPALYKILTEEIGGTACLAIAPIHCYIKHKDESGKWVNLEMTSGSFARDEWIMQQAGVTVEQIKSGIYMNALSENESLALVLKELASNFQLQFGTNAFDLAVIETGLQYYPVGVTLYLAKYEHYRKSLLKARKQNDLVWEDLCNKTLFDIDQKLASLAYKTASKSDYAEWIKENEKGKQAKATTKLTSTTNK